MWSLCNVLKDWRKMSKYQKSVGMLVRPHGNLFFYESFRGDAITRILTNNAGLCIVVHAPPCTSEYDRVGILTPQGRILYLQTMQMTVIE